MRKPQVDNKYNLTMAKIRRLKIADRSKVCEPLFWRNDVIGAWCICGSSGNDMDRRFATNNEFWISIYDLNAKAYAGKFRVSLSSYGGMCGYKFNKFFDVKDIDNEQDLEIQEKFLAKINELIDCGILAFNTEAAEIGGGKLINFVQIQNKVMELAA